MAEPPLIRSVPLALSLGAVVGGALGGLTFGPWGGVWCGLAGVAGGVVFGVISSLDLLVAGPGRRSRLNRAPVAGPFRSMASFAFATVASLLAAAFLVGRVSCDCTRRPAGEVDCVRTVTAWLDRSLWSVRRFPDVQTAVPVREAMVQLSTADPLDAGALDGFGPEAARQITAFLTSDEETLHLESRGLWYAPLIFLAIAAVTARLTVRCFRWGRAELHKQLSQPDRVSATGW